MRDDGVVALVGFLPIWSAGFGRAKKEHRTQAGQGPTYGACTWVAPSTP